MEGAPEKLNFVWSQSTSRLHQLQNSTPPLAGGRSCMEALIHLAWTVRVWYRPPKVVAPKPKCVLDSPRGLIRPLQTTELIQRYVKRLVNVTLLLLRYCVTKVLFEVVCYKSFVWGNVSVCCSQVTVSWKTISRQTAKRNSVKHRSFWQGNCVEDDQ